MLNKIENYYQSVLIDLNQKNRWIELKIYVLHANNSKMIKYFHWNAYLIMEHFWIQFFRWTMKFICIRFKNYYKSNDLITFIEYIENDNVSNFFGAVELTTIICGFIYTKVGQSNEYIKIFYMWWKWSDQLYIYWIDCNNKCDRCSNSHGIHISQYRFMMKNSLALLFYMPTKFETQSKWQSSTVLFYSLD